MTVQTVEQTQAKTDKGKAEFRIFSGALTPFSGSDGKLRLRTVASSSVVDLGGDEVTLNALQNMAASAKGMTVFRNHSYKVPHDILGTVEDASVRQAGLDGNGKPIYEMPMNVLVFADNPENVQTHSAIQSGVKLGTSIGAMIPPGSASKNTSGGYTFDDLRLLEASIVGIPQNPRSFVEYATKAYKASIESEEEDEDTNPEFHADATPDTEKAKVWVSHDSKGNHAVTVDTDAAMEPMESPPDSEKAESKSKKKVAKPDSVSAINETDEEKAEDKADTSELDDDVDWANLPEGDQAEADALYAELDAEELILKSGGDLITKAPLSSEARSNLSDSQFACPEKRKYPIQDKAHIRNALARCGDPSNDQCGCGKVRAAARAAGIGEQKDILPDITASIESVESPDSTSPVTSDPAVMPETEDNATQELEKSAPESAGDASEESEEVQFNDTMTRSASVLADMLKATSRELVSIRKERDEAQTAKDVADKERDDALANLEFAKEIIVKFAATPLGRKAVFHEAMDDFSSRFAGIYSPEVLKIMEK